MLSNDQLAAFRENGYLILREVLDPHTCQKFDKDFVQPALLKHAGIDERDPKTFHSSIALLHSFATGEFEFKKINGGRCSSATASATTSATTSTSTSTSTSTRSCSKANTKNKSINCSTCRSSDNKDHKSDAKNNHAATIENDAYFLPGVMIRMPNGDDPIPDRYCLDMSPLNSILDQLHNDGDQIHTCDDNEDDDGGNMKSNVEVIDAGVSADPTATATGTRNWEWLHSNLGWIHVRFPCAVPISSSNRKVKEAKPPNENDDHKADLHVCACASASSSRSWHVDGGHFTPHHLNSREQSVIVLPMIRDVAKGGGNTMVLKRSHIYMAQKLHAADSKVKGVHTHTHTHSHIHHDLEGKAQDRQQQNSSLGGGGIPKEETQNANDIAAIWPDDMIVEMAPCGAGDVLLMHPFLVHAAGIAEIGHPMRIAFNVGVR